MSDRLVIFDTTLRDGEQAPGFSMRIEEKIRLARQLERLGVDIIEAGFPISSEDDAESVRRVAQSVTEPVVAALARCATGDVDKAATAIAPARRGRIHTFIATSDLHLEFKLRMTREKILKEIKDVINTKSKAGAFTLVLDSSTAEPAGRPPVVLYTNGDNDLTAAVLDTLNANAPADLPKTDTKKDEKK